MENIKQLFKNEIIKKILFFFNDNPNSIDTAKGISVWIGSNVNAVQKALERLVDEGVLINYKTTSTNAYSYTNNRDIIRKIEKYIKDQENRLHR